MLLYDILNDLYPNRILIPETMNNIPLKKYVVYILAHKNIPIVVGHGKKNRATIIFDSLNKKTSSHMKAFLVRVYNIFYENDFERFIIECSNKEEAKEIEISLHRNIGGNTCELPESLYNFIISNIENHFAKLLLQLAMYSSFDGLDDLKKWRKKRVIDDSTWNIISNKLQLSKLGWS